MTAGGTKKLHWRLISGVDQRRLKDARLETHYAMQWLARFARAYFPPQPDDGHASMEWDHSFNGFDTQPLNNGMLMSSEIGNLLLMLRDSQGGAAEGFSLDGQTNMCLRQWLGEQLSARGLDPNLLDASSPYTIPAHAISQGGAYSVASIEDALGELTTWFANGDVVLRDIRRQMISNQLSVGPVCCWPHHFDLATLATLPIRSAEKIGYIGVGLSPGDEYYEEPYFYISLSPQPEPATLPNLSPLGHWHTHEFTAAIALAHKIVGAKEQEMHTREFLRHSVITASQLLK
jgi:hypothetical protein